MSTSSNNKQTKHKATAKCAKRIFKLQLMHQENQYLPLKKSGNNDQNKLNPPKNLIVLDLDTLVFDYNNFIITTTTYDEIDD